MRKVGGMFAALVMIALLGPSGAPARAAAQRQATPPAPACAPNGPVTPSQTEGPFYKANTPERTSLIESGMPGTRLIITGYVLARDCRPVSRAWLDFWQANDRGEYDNAGYRLRGHQSADDTGIYYLETIMPGLYTGRTRHIHVKVRAPKSPTLTTQLYFPGETRNQSDGIFNQGLLATVRDGAGGKIATFNFVLDSR